jgi:hypothetical protein
MKNDSELIKHFKENKKQADIRLSSKTNQDQFISKIEKTFIAKNKKLPFKFHRLNEKFENKFTSKPKEIKKLTSDLRIQNPNLTSAEKSQLVKSTLFENLCFLNYKEVLNLVNDLINYFVINFELKNFIYIKDSVELIKNEIQALMVKNNKYINYELILNSCNMNYEVISNYSFDNIKGKSNSMKILEFKK